MVCILPYIIHLLSQYDVANNENTKICCYNNEINSPNGYSTFCDFVSQKSNSNKINTEKKIISEENSLENATNSDNFVDSLVTITSERNILAENDTKKLTTCSNAILQKATELSTNDRIEFSSLEKPNAEIVCSYLSPESEPESNSLHFVEMTATVPLSCGTAAALEENMTNSHTSSDSRSNVYLSEGEPGDESVFYDSDMYPEYKPENNSSFEELIIENNNEDSENPYLQKEIRISTNKRPSNDFPIEVTTRKNYTDRRDFCFFCDKNVSHFARHLFTWHDTEIEVQRIQSLKTNSKEKRNLVSQLRKKGNFIRNGSEGKLRPVKRVQVGDKSNRDDFLPCPFCLGFYKRKTLYRHTKICNASLEKNTKRQTAQSNGQTTLLLHKTVKHCELLRVELFPRMRADDISFIAKKDTLICAYAYSYMKGRRSKGNIDLVRQNVRRLARLIKFARERNDKVKELIDILHPESFHVILGCVNLIADYNNDTELYESPKVAFNFLALLKKCCDLAVIQLLQKNNTEKQRDDIKTLKTLIESQWENEVPAQAQENVAESDRDLTEVISNAEEVESNESKKDEDKLEKTKKRKNLKKLNQQETKKTTKKSKKIERQPWSGAEKKLLATYFKKHIEQKRAPGIQDVKKFVDKYPDIMKDRKWTSVKATVYNIYSGKLKV